VRREITDRCGDECQPFRRSRSSHPTTAIEAMVRIGPARDEPFVVLGIDIGHARKQTIASVRQARELRRARRARL